jgi:hypothetical protein
MRLPQLISAACVLTLSLTLPSAAQTEQPAGPASPCQAQPDQNSNTGNNNGQTGTEQPSGDLSQKLDPCNGVLKPPPTGDTEMTEPAPNEGKTPVIKPGEVPPQPPKQ